METIFMNTENSKTNEPHKFVDKGCVRYIFASLFFAFKREHL